jgi:hypothetical protein
MAAFSGDAGAGRATTRTADSSPPAAPASRREVARTSLTPIRTMSIAALGRRTMSDTASTANAEPLGSGSGVHMSAGICRGSGEMSRITWTRSMALSPSTSA